MNIEQFAKDQEWLNEIGEKATCVLGDYAAACYEAGEARAGTVTPKIAATGTAVVDMYFDMACKVLELEERVRQLQAAVAK